MLAGIAEAAAAGSSSVAVAGQHLHGHGHGPSSHAAAVAAAAALEQRRAAVADHETAIQELALGLHLRLAKLAAFHKQTKAEQVRTQRRTPVHA